MSAPVTGPRVLFSIRTTRVESLWFLTTRLFTASTMSAASSRTPLIVVNSWSEPASLICVTALPSRLESSTRRRLLPTVVPKPRSNGSAVNLPYVEVRVLGSAVTAPGSSRPRQRICMRHSLKNHLEQSSMMRLAWTGIETSSARGNRSTRPSGIAPSPRERKSGTSRRKSASAV